MNIKETLIGQSKYDAYSCYQAEINDFVSFVGDFKKRQRMAMEMINNILTDHGKGELLKYVASLAEIEHGIKELQPLQRDHVVHALLTFVLGIYINETWMTTKVDAFQWKLAALLHDVAYPAEISFKILGSIPKNMNKIACSLGFPDRRIKATTKLEGIEELSNGINGLDLMQAKIQQWGLNIDAHAEYKMVSDNTPCHGVYSALCVLSVLDMMYQRYNPDREYRHIPGKHYHLNFDQSYFENDIVSACTAIFLHNLPPRCFEKARIDKNRTPVCFLLKLCDVLQEWERPSGKDGRGFPGEEFAIEITEGVLKYFVPSNRKKRIYNGIENILEMDGIEII